MSNTNIKDQLNALGWSVNMDLFDGSKQRIEDIKKKLLDVSVVR
jgi:hypothetical protein